MSCLCDNDPEQGITPVVCFLGQCPLGHRTYFPKTTTDISGIRRIHCDTSVAALASVCDVHVKYNSVQDRSA